MLPFVLAAEAGTLELSDRVGADVRAGTGIQGSAYDASDLASARVTMSERRWNISAGYSPSFSLSGGDHLPATGYVLQAENVGASWHDRRLTLSLVETGSYGWQTTAGLVPQPGVLTQAQPIQGLPANLTTIQVVTLGSSAGVAYRPSRRWTLGVSLGESIFGGAREVDRTVAPLTAGLYGAASASFAMSRVDSAFMRITGYRSWTHSGPCLVPNATTPNAPGVLATCAPDSYLGAAYIGEQHRFSQHSTGNADVGFAIAESRLLSGDPYTTGVYPVADVGYIMDFGARAARVSLRFDLQLAPIVDQRTGAVEYAARGTGTARWLLPSRTTLAWAVGALQSLGGAEESPGSVLYTSGTVEVPMGKFFALSAMASYFLEDQEGGPTTTSVAVFVGATVHTLPVRFQL